VTRIEDLDILVQVRSAGSIQLDQPGQLHQVLGQALAVQVQVPTRGLPGRERLASSATMGPCRTETTLQSLSPGYFPFVMATSIISTGTSLLGPSWLSRTLLVIASAALAVLIVATVLQLVLFRPNVAAAFRAPERVFGYFAIAAGMDVLGIRLAAAGHPLATAILAGVRNCLTDNDFSYTVAFSSAIFE